MALPSTAAVPLEAYPPGAAGTPAAWNRPLGRARIGHRTARDDRPSPFRWRCGIVNRTQALVLGFFAVVLAILIGILVFAADVYDEALSLPAGRGRSAEIVFLATLSAFIGLLSVGVLRRWRWLFWLILVAFLFGVLRVPVAVLQLTGAVAATTPTWYVVLQGLIGAAQLAIAVAMLAGYRRSGIWGT